ncbi:SGNH/GDSL hydrolase family protein [Pelagibacterales bacterium SAG-MED32]|nr:SGNH/GDSL hydrolase family protein [Pelagibacterales bacterium SAG-MED32]
MNHVKTSLYILITWAISLVLVLIFFEVLLRLSKDKWHEAESLYIIRDNHIIYKLNDLYPNELEYVDYIRNFYGLRDKCESPAKIDILTLGGSTTDQRYVSIEDTYQNILQDRINSFLKTDICISNAGIDGHSTYGHLLSFKNWFPLIDGLNPKIFLFYIGINDSNFLRTVPEYENDTLRTTDYLNLLAQNPSGNNLKNFLKQFMVTKSLLKIRLMIRSQFPQEVLFAQHTQQNLSDNNYLIENLNPLTKIYSEKNATEFRIRLRSLLKMVENYNSKFICVTQPQMFTITKEGRMYGIPNLIGEGFSGLDFDYSQNELNKVIKEECGLENTLDLYKHKDKLTYQHLYDGLHTTKIGSKFIGDLMFEELKKNNILNYLN